MATFTDNKGRSWEIALDVAAMKRVRSALGVDLYKATDDGLRPLGELLKDGILFVDVLFVLCREQAKEQGVSDEDFGRGLAGDAVEHAAAAFLEALVSFTPSQKRAALEKALALGRAVQAGVMAGVARELDRMAADPLATLRTPSDSPTGSPASAG